MRKIHCRIHNSGKKPAGGAANALTWWRSSSADAQGRGVGSGEKSWEGKPLPTLNRMAGSMAC